MGCRSAFHVKAAEALWEFNRSSGQLPSEKPARWAVR